MKISTNLYIYTVALCVRAPRATLMCKVHQSILLKYMSNEMSKIKLLIA